MSIIKKGIILAGGKGSRLHPLTKPIAKPLLPVFDKPQIYYSLTILMELGIKDILLIVAPGQDQHFKLSLGDGSDYGIKITYEVQRQPNGIPDAFIIGKDFINNDPVALILADNIFYPIDQIKSGFDSYKQGGMVFGYPVPNPSEYGVADVDSGGKVLNLEEKPVAPKSNLAVIGLYLFDEKITTIAAGQKPSARGELEILDSIQAYLFKNSLQMITLDKALIWYDAGTADSMMAAAEFIRSEQAKTNCLIGSPEETALRLGYIDQTKFDEVIARMPNCQYKTQLQNK